jgi:hypothetical protein
MDGCSTAQRRGNRANSETVPRAPRTRHGGIALMFVDLQDVIYH